MMKMLIYIRMMIDVKIPSVDLCGSKTNSGNRAMSEVMQLCIQAWTTVCGCAWVLALENLKVSFICLFRKSKTGTVTFVLINS